ncbi:Histone acetyltransferase [Novosphingobium resinovorum]|uniref:Histone acetyltransferase n=1 Tax=Novosphingobium resinovorum TaxID=158500 RepID=A0A031K0B9_9SPHN|nr:GNAT family N-acetyltransferase [Novosphingobium resinovorum]EZP82468.1 Histone acetyltransferase [Novosphingobium resinovorum]
MTTRTVTAPAPLRADHDADAFASGQHDTLDSWLRERALTSEGLSARTYVICDAAVPKRIIGYYTITTAMEQRTALPSAKLRRAMPEQVPLLLIARLAIDRDWQGLGLGGDLLGDALRRCLAASKIAGARGIAVHAIDETAAGFYEHHGFLRSPLGELTLILPVEALRAVIG